MSNTSYYALKSCLIYITIPNREKIAIEIYILTSNYFNLKSFVTDNVETSKAQ
jgi:hypothetical protein